MILTYLKNYNSRKKIELKKKTPRTLYNLHFTNSSKLKQSNNSTQQLNSFLKQGSNQTQRPDQELNLNIPNLVPNKNIIKLDMHVACNLSVRNCEKFLPKIFENLNKLSQYFTQFSTIFVYDNCIDKTQLLLDSYKKKSTFPVYLIDNKNNDSPHRTVRIANARNKGLDIIYNNLQNVDYHMIIDADDVNYFAWNIKLIIHYLQRNDWDGLSFNRKINTSHRKGYYDIWALLYHNINYHYLGFNSPIKNSEIPICKFLKQDIQNKINKVDKNDLFECRSAFNGFAIYRTSKFKNIVYDGLYKNLEPLISEQAIIITLHFLNKKFPNLKLSLNKNFIEVCEHQYYHINAIQQNNARIRISPHCLHF